MKITLEVEPRGNAMKRIHETWFEHGDADRSTDEEKVAWFVADRVDGPIGCLDVLSWEVERMPGMEECSHLVLFEDPCEQCEAEKRIDADRAALDHLNLLLSADEWPGASGMEDVAEIVRATGRKEIPDAPEWPRH